MGRKAKVDNPYARMYYAVNGPDLKEKAKARYQKKRYGGTPEEQEEFKETLRQYRRNSVANGTLKKQTPREIDTIHHRCDRVIGRWIRLNNPEQYEKMLQENFTDPRYAMAYAKIKNVK